MFQTINGWTKEKMKAFIKENFKGKSEDMRGNCLYRSADGRKCAVGIFIPDEKYDKKMDKGVENGGTKASVVIRDFGLGALMPLDNEGMGALQHVHDDSGEESCLDNMINFINEQVADS